MRCQGKKSDASLYIKAAEGRAHHCLNVVRSAAAWRLRSSRAPLLQQLSSRLHTSIQMTKCWRCAGRLHCAWKNMLPQHLSLHKDVSLRTIDHRCGATQMFSCALQQQQHGVVEGLALAGREACHRMRAAHMHGSLRGASVNLMAGLQAHGVIMAVSFVAIIPISVIISSSRHRFLGSSWLQIHRALGVRQLHLLDLLVQQPWPG